MRPVFRKFGLESWLAPDRVAAGLFSGILILGFLIASGQVYARSDGLKKTDQFQTCGFSALTAMGYRDIPAGSFVPYYDERPGIIISNVSLIYGGPDIPRVPVDIDGEYTWPIGYTTETPDTVICFNHNNGVFGMEVEVTSPSHAYNNDAGRVDPSRNGVSGKIQFYRSYLKQSPDAWVKFHISHMEIIYSDYTPLRDAPGAAHGSVHAVAWSRSIDHASNIAEFFRQDAWLTERSTDCGITTESLYYGPMPFEKTVNFDANGCSTAMVADHYTTTSDLSIFGVGEEIEVGMIVNAGATSWGFNFGERYYNPRMYVYFRDPIDSGAGTSVESSGVEEIPVSIDRAPRDQARAHAIQNNTVIAAGLAFNGSDNDFALARYTSAGQLDTAGFGGGTGKVMTNFGGEDSANALVIQTDGKILVGGSAGQGDVGVFALARYMADGQLDTGFGADNSGKVLQAIGSFRDSVEALALQGTKILAVGTSFTGSRNAIAIACFNADGTLDTTFGTDGKVIVDAGVNEYGRAAMLDGSGNIVVAGLTDGQGLSHTDFVVLRFHSDGTPDTGFGTNGRTVVDFNGGPDIVTDLKLVSDPGGDRIVVAGHSYNGSKTAFAALSLHANNGSLDTSFGNAGKASLEFSGHHAFARSLAVQADGKLVLAGYVDNDNDKDFAVARLNTDGSPDTSINSVGYYVYDFAQGDDQANSVTIQPDGRIVVSGTAFTEHGDDFAIVRLNP